MISVVIPVYNNEPNIPSLLEALESIQPELESELEVVFVVDGSPDDSHAILAVALRDAPFSSQLLRLSRNFGSFAAIRAGLMAARGDYSCVLAADLQEPIELIATFERELLKGHSDIVVGQRVGRADPLLTRLFSGLFWALYRRFVIRDLPPGGVDVFGCTRRVRDDLVRLAETNSSLVGLLFWIGFKRTFVPYERRRRTIGKSAWTFGRKVRYLSDSVFSFSDLPIRLLTQLGIWGLVISVVFASVVLVVKLSGSTIVPGYAATVLLVTFFGALNCFGLGVVGGYVWRTFQNTNRRPHFLVDGHETFEGRQPKYENSVHSSAGSGRD